MADKKYEIKQGKQGGMTIEGDGQRWELRGLEWKQDKAWKEGDELIPSSLQPSVPDASDEKKPEERKPDPTKPRLLVNEQDALSLTKFRNTFPEYDNYTDPQIISGMKKLEPDRFGKLNDKTVTAVLNAEHGSLLPNFRASLPEYEEYSDDQILTGMKKLHEDLAPLNQSQLAYALEDQAFKNGSGKRKPSLRAVDYKDGISFEEFLPMVGLKPAVIPLPPSMPFAEPLTELAAKELTVGIAGLLKGTIRMPAISVDLVLHRGQDADFENFSRKFITDDKYRGALRSQYDVEHPETKGMNNNDFINYVDKNKPMFLAPKWMYDNIATRVLSDIQKAADPIQAKYGTTDTAFITENYGWAAGLESMVGNSINSMPATLAAMAVTWYTKNPNYGAAIVAASTMPQSYYETKHKTYSDKLKYTLAVAAAEYAGERWGTFGLLDKYMKTISVPGVSKALIGGIIRKELPKFLVDSVIRNGLEEFSTQMAQGYAGKLWVPGEEGKTFNQLVNESIYAGLAGMTQAILMAPLGGMLGGGGGGTSPGQTGQQPPGGPGPTAPPGGPGGTGPTAPPGGGRGTPPPLKVRACHNGKGMEY